MFLLGFSIANLSEQVVMTAKRMVERVEATPRADGMMIVCDVVRTKPRGLCHRRPRPEVMLDLTSEEQLIRD